MGARMLRKGLAVAVILLFIGMCVVPSTQSIQNKIIVNDINNTSNQNGDNFFLELIILILDFRCLMAFKRVEFAFRLYENLSVISFFLLLRGIWIFVISAIFLGIISEIYERNNWDWNPASEPYDIGV